jgi:hypothetical protein
LRSRDHQPRSHEGDAAFQARHALGIASGLPRGAQLLARFLDRLARERRRLAQGVAAGAAYNGEADRDDGNSDGSGLQHVQLPSS